MIFKLLSVNSWFPFKLRPLICKSWNYFSFSDLFWVTTMDSMRRAKVSSFKSASMMLNSLFLSLKKI